MKCPSLIATALIAVLVAGCTVGPDYVRPDTQIPASYRFAAGGETGAANVEWWSQIGDPTLTRLINTALAGNLDLKIAAARVDQASAVLTSQNSQFYPQVGYSATAERSRLAEIAGGTAPNPRTVYEPLIGAGWQLDLWGRIRRQNEAAAANLVGAEEARRGVVLTLVAAVASTYLQLRALDAQLAVAEETEASYAQGLKLFEDRFKYGQISEVTVSQMRVQYETAAAAVPRIAVSIGRTENALSLLIGQTPRAIPRGKAFADLKLPRVPAGLPSDLLARRPDIAQAEQNLIAANANIGVAEAMYFPSVSLTGTAGSASSSLDNLLSHPSSEWSLAAGVTGPIFDAGNIAGQILVSKAQKTEALAQYQKTILNALREVSDGFVGYSQSRSRLAAEERLVDAQETTARLAYLSFEEGSESYTTVLVAQQNLLEARLEAIEARYDTFASLVDIYKAMGGGWVDQAAKRAPPPGAEKATPVTVKPAFGQ